MLTKIKILFWILFSLSYFSYAQLTTDWVNSTGGTNSDFGFAIAVDSNNNVFMAGQFRSNVNIA